MEVLYNILIPLAHAAEPEIPVAQQVGNFYAWAVGISALIALGILVYAGLSYTAAGGNASRQQDAKQWIWSAFIGLLLLFGSYIILNTINPEFTHFKDLDLSQVNFGQAAGVGQESGKLDLAQLIGNFYNWALGIGGLVALGIIIFGGILYTISPGNSSRQNDAKIWIFSALIGLLLLFGSYAILNTFNPDLTRLVSLEESLKNAKFIPAAQEAVTEVDLSQLISNFYSWVLGIGGILALGVLIFAGILYTTSAGNVSRQDEAKNWILGALVGLLLLFGSYAILNTVNPELTKLDNIKELLSGQGGIELSPHSKPQGREELSLSELTNKRLGRKDLAGTGVFENWNCGGAGGGSNLYGGFCSLTESPANCDELRGNGVDCPKPVFISILDLVGSPPGLFKVPVPSKVLAPFFPVGLTLPSVGYEGGNCQLPLNPVLTDNIAELKRTVPECSGSERCFVQLATTACTAESVDNSRGHPVQSHLELRAVDLVTSGKNRGLASIPKEWETKDRAILSFLGQSYCVNNLIAPSRLNEPGKLPCRKDGRPVRCAGLTDAEGNEEEVIHYDVLPESECSEAQKYADKRSIPEIAKSLAGVSDGGDEPTGTGGEGGEKVPLGIAQQIGNLYAWALGIGALIALGVLIFGGILYTISAGNASRQDDAKSWLLGGVAGIFLLFSSYLILNTVNPELTKLKDLELIVNKAAQLDSFGPRIDTSPFSGPDCGGVYVTGQKGADKGNFGDPGCEAQAGANPQYRQALATLLQERDPANALHWYQTVIPCETGPDGQYNPNAFNPNTPDPRGAWGLFQMGVNGRANPRYDFGARPWRDQVNNAVNLLRENSSRYWACW